MNMDSTELGTLIAGCWLMLGGVYFLSEFSFRDFEVDGDAEAKEHG
jgi:hypothetical protein